MTLISCSGPEPWHSAPTHSLSSWIFLQTGSLVLGLQPKEEITRTLSSSKFWACTTDRKNTRTLKFSKFWTRANQNITPLELCQNGKAPDKVNCLRPYKKRSKMRSPLWVLLDHGGLHLAAPLSWGTSQDLLPARPGQRLPPWNSAITCWVKLMHCEYLF